MLFIYTAYTANIISLLQSSSNAINTLDDLYHSSMEFGIEDTPYHRHWFPAQTEKTRKAIYRDKIAPPNQPPHYMNLSYGMSRLRQGLFTFHVEASTGYNLIEVANQSVVLVWSFVQIYFINVLASTKSEHSLHINVYF